MNDFKNISPTEIIRRATLGPISKPVPQPACLAIGILLLAMVALFAGTAQAQVGSESPNITAKASKNVVQVAEAFQLELQLEVAAGSEVFFPVVGAQLGKFDVLEHRDVFDLPATTNPTKLRTWTRRLTLESIATGNLEIPSIEVQVSQGGTLETVETNPIPVQVISVLEDRADPSQFRDIRSVVDIDVPQPESYAWVAWGLGGSIAVICVVALIAAAVRRKKYITPREWALGELLELGESEAMQAGDTKTVLDSLSGILKGFIQLQFNVSAPMFTTDELLQTVANQSTADSAELTKLRELLALTDQAKFAGMTIDRTELLESVQTASAMVQSIEDSMQAETSNVTNSASNLPSQSGEDQ